MPLLFLICFLFLSIFSKKRETKKKKIFTISCIKTSDFLILIPVSISGFPIVCDAHSFYKGEYKINRVYENREERNSVNNRSIERNRVEIKVFN